MRREKVEEWTSYNLKLRKEDWKKVKEEASRLGIPAVGFLRMLIRQYFNGIKGIKFEREHIKKDRGR